MSRSIKKHAVVRQIGWMKRTYWRVVRRVSKQKLNSDKEIPNPKEIVNDWDYCDWKYEYDKSDGEWFKKSLRK